MASNYLDQQRRKKAQYNRMMGIRSVTFVVGGKNRTIDLSPAQIKTISATDFWRKRKTQFNISERDFALMLLKYKIG